MSGTIQPGNKVRAACTTLFAEVTPDGTDWEIVDWQTDQNKSMGAVLCSSAVLAQLRAFAETADCAARVLGRPNVAYPWVELVAQQTVAASAPTALSGASGDHASDEEVSDQAILDAQIPGSYELMVQVKQLTAGGSITLALMLK